MLIVFEGIDGAGTTAHSKALVETLKQADPEQTTHWDCEPSKAAIGVFIRDIFEGRHGSELPHWRAMTMLFQADREAVLWILKARLQRSCTVVMDRSWMSTLVYQSASAMQEGASFEEAADWIISLNEHMPVPDLTIILDVPVEEAFRRKNKPPDLYEARKDFQETVRRLYSEVAGEHIVRINSDRPFEKVSEDVYRAVRKVQLG